METKRQNEDQTEALKREYQAVMKLNETFTAVNDNLIEARGKLQVGDFCRWCLLVFAGVEARILVLLIHNLSLSNLQIRSIKQTHSSIYG